MSATLFRHPMTLLSTATKGSWLGLVETLSDQKGYYLLLIGIACHASVLGHILQFQLN